MRVVSVNVGQSEPITIGGREARSGIFKRPVTRRVPVGPLGLAGDTQVSKRHHGGPDQAVYLYGRDDYAWWSGELDRDLDPGTFGENLTLDTLGEPVRLGDRYRIGSLLLEVTAPRVPCATLAARMGDSAFVKHFHSSGRVGAYARVLQEGSVAAGDEVEHSPASLESPTMVEVLRLYAGTRAEREDVPQLERVLASRALAVRARRGLSEELLRLQARG